MNNPVRYTDPSGHCAFDEQGNIIKWDCTLGDFNNLTWQQRIDWVEAFMAETGVNWFYNVIGILEYFSNDMVFADSAWAMKSDAGVLLAINDGYRIFKGERAIGSYKGFTPGNNPANLWAIFFRNHASNQNFIATYTSWGRAEQAGVNYGVRIAVPHYKQAGLLEEIKIDVFVGWGNIYRKAITDGGDMLARGRGLGVLAPWNPASMRFVRHWSSTVVNAMTYQIYAELQRPVYLPPLMP